MNAREQLYHLKLEVEKEYLENIQPYWFKYSVDHKLGGFYGQVSNDNIPVIESKKGGILNARILWSFSAAYKMFKSEESKELSHRAYNYLMEYLVDKENGGIYWMLDHLGNISDDRKHVYVQAFAIYGLTEYYSAFGVPQALDYALKLYDLIEHNCKDNEYGGYFEAYSKDWKLIEDVRLSEKDKNEPKSMNTHLHVLEGYTNLYRYAPNTDIENNLKDLLNKFQTFIFNDDKDSLICFMDVDWSRKSKRISYGHDIEASWLCVEAAEVLEDKKLIESFNEIALKVSRKVINGTDEDGGIINELTTNRILDSNKDWWPQAEALVGHLNAYQISKDVFFLEAALKSWKFIKEFIIDTEYGEWYEKVSREGSPYLEMDKIRSWKAPYHNSRTMFGVSRRVKLLLENKDEKKVS